MTVIGLREPKTVSGGHDGAKITTATQVASSGQQHWKRAQLALQRIEPHAERFERKRTKESVITFLAEDHISDANMIFVTEQSATFSPTYGRPIRQSKLVLDDGCNPQFSKNWFRHNCVNCA